MDVVDLREFYDSELGQAVRRLVTKRLAPRFKLASGQTVLGLGYALPYMEDLALGHDRSLAFMMARRGVIHWPLAGDVRAALVDEYDLPLLESVADAVIVTHGLELAEDPLEMLQEIWRVMAPQGRLYLVVPNRRGIWSASEATPFGYGQPFSRSQILGLLKEARFSVSNWYQALFLPPLKAPALIKAGEAVEWPMMRLLGRFSGVLIVEAMKQVYAFSSGKRARRLVPRLRPVLLPAPQPAGRSHRIDVPSA